jgi:hypothetical protein
VIKASNGQTVGAYRLGAVPDAAFSLAIPGIIQNGQGYRVDFFADLNGNGTYDAPPADHAWQLTGTGTASGLSLDFAHNANFTDIKLVSSGAPAAAARGTITGFGSVKVNGVEFETTGATRFKVDDNAGATENNLKVGMVVNVKGRIADDGVHGTATEIEFENSIEGPVGTVSLAAGNITVMGKTIKLNDVTIFEGKAAGQLQTGDLVEVSGVEAANGTILARRIELKGAGDTEAEIKGALSNLTSTTFTLGGLTVNYASAAIDNSVAAAGGLKNGLFVEVKGAPPPSGGVLTATRVELDDDGVPEAEGAEVRLEGLVTEVTAGSASGTSEFKVDGHPVKAAAGVFKRGVPTDLAVGLSVEAEGVIDAAGALVAKEVSFELARNVKIEGDVQSVNAVAGTVRVLGVDVNVDSSTQLRDKRTDGDFGLADLAAGDRVSVRAFIDPVSNTAVAAKLESDATKNRAIVQGPVSGASGNILTILGAPFDTTAILDNQLRDAAGTQMTRGNFLAAALQSGNLAKLRGSVQPGGSVTWERAEIEVEHNFENEHENEFEQEREIEVEIENGTSGGGDSTLLDFTLNFTGMVPHVGQLLEVRVINASNGLTVGTQRVTAVPGPAFSVAIPGIVENGQSYQVDFFADLNGNGVYNAPPADHAWRLTGTAGAAGLTLDFAHNAVFTDVQF